MPRQLLPELQRSNDAIVNLDCAFVAYPFVFSVENFRGGPGPPWLADTPLPLSDSPTIAFFSFFFQPLNATFSGHHFAKRVGYEKPCRDFV